VFIGATVDRRFRAFDAKTGKELWVTELPANGNATPITYMGKDGVQYVVIAAAGGGQYFELDRDPDRDIANKIIDAGRRQAPATTEEGTIEELYWRFLAAAIGLAALGSLLLRERTELWIQLGATLATGVAIWSLIAV